MSEEPWVPESLHGEAAWLTSDWAHEEQVGFHWVQTLKGPLWQLHVTTLMAIVFDGQLESPWLDHL